LLKVSCELLIWPMNLALTPSELTRGRDCTSSCGEFFPGSGPAKQHFRKALSKSQNLSSGSTNPITLEVH
jgi:hypothetical protein